MNPTDPLQSLRNACAAIDRAKAELESRLSDGAEAAAVRAKLDTLRRRLHETHDGLQKQLDQAMPGGPLPPTDPALAAKFAALDAKAAAGRERFGALALQMPKLPPPQPVVPLDGHTLGKLLLVELGLVAARIYAAPKTRVVDEEGFRWESTGEWDALGP